MLKTLFILIISTGLLISCGTDLTTNNEENLKRMDKIFGPCDNPHRQYTKISRQVCKDKLRAAGPDGEIGESIDLLGIFSKGQNSNTIYTASAVNKNLWDGSLITLESYPLKNLDFEGGIIETNWIIEDNNPNQRCLIRTHITSPELVSNGISVKIICQKKIKEEWFVSKENFLEEEKQLTIKILEEAVQLNQAKSL